MSEASTSDTSTTDSVSLNEASERLGVHYMTAYRYIRTGRLAAEKRGGQWYVRLEDLAEVQTGRTTQTKRSDILPSRVEERLLASDENGTFQILEDAMAAGASADEIYLDLLVPALTNIGQRWHDGELEIAEEHVATATAIRVISRVGNRIGSRRGRSRGTIVLASVAQDHHLLPTAMMKDLLGSRGFEVSDLGANTPALSIASLAASKPDLVAIGISATTEGAEVATIDTILEIRAILPTIPIVVGGSAFKDEESIRELGDCIPSTSARHALEIFDRLHGEQRAN